MANTKRMRPLLGTYVEVGVHVAEMPEHAINAAFEAIGNVQSLMSFHTSDSDLSRLNLAGGKEVTLHPHSIKVLRLARAMTYASGGLFNCTVGGALVRLGILPDHGVRVSLESGVADDIELQGNKARLKRAVHITLDGIAKGYAVDCAVQAMQANGVSAGWVNAGGDLRVFGNFVLPVQRREMDGSFLTLGGLQEASVATSTVRSEHDKTFPAWVFSEYRTPQTGTWSVLARKAWRADALTKVASLANPAERNALIERLGGKLAIPAGALTPCA